MHRCVEAASVTPCYEHREREEFWCYQKVEKCNGYMVAEIFLYVTSSCA
jgi:hypothetical protein